MRTQVKIYDDPEPTMSDIKDDKELFLNPKLDKQTLKEKFFLSKIPTVTSTPCSPWESYLQTFSMDELPEKINYSQ